MISITDYTLLTPAVAPALDLAIVKDNLRISDNDSDTRLLNLINVASTYAEKITGRDLITKTYKGYLDRFPTGIESFYFDWALSNRCPIQIRKSKLQSIVSIQYYLDGVLTTWSSDNYYITDSSDFATINLVDGKSYPTSVDRRRQAIIITFNAGYGDGNCDIPSGIQQAMLSNISLLYENAGDCIDESNPQFKILYVPYIISSNFFRVI